MTKIKKSKRLVKFYTPEEVAIISDLSRSESEVAKLLSGRSPESIWQKRKALGLKGPNNKTVNSSSKRDTHTTVPAGMLLVVNNIELTFKSTAKVSISKGRVDITI